MLIQALIRKLINIREENVIYFYCIIPRAITLAGIIIMITISQIFFKQTYL